MRHGLAVLFVITAVTTAYADSRREIELKDRAARRENKLRADSLRPMTIAETRSDHWILIPAAGSVQGAGGTYFRSDLMISNHRNVAQRVEVHYAPQGQDGALGPEVTLTIPANTAVFYDDFIANTMSSAGLGTLDLRARTATGSLDTSAKIDAFSRIWTNQPNSVGTVSQSFPSVRVDQVEGGKSVYVLGLQHDDRFRTNVGIFNFDVSNPHTWTVQVIGTRGQTTFQVTVRDWSMAQVPLPTGTYGNLYLILTPEAGIGSFDWWSAYGSSVDNLTGDGWVSIGSQND